jgi:glycine hydroxymethyltransferase
MIKNIKQEDLSQKDPLIYNIIEQEYNRQHSQLELIASENFASPNVMAVQGSVLTNKYAEGYPGKRYYHGCDHVDSIENIAIERAQKLFQCDYVNVQPHSGSQANQAVFLALLNCGDTFMGMSLDCGGHLTHGASVNMSGKWFKPIAYGVDPQTHLIDMDQVRDLARKHRPKVIIAGGSAYPRIIDFAAFRAIADEIGAYFWVDMAHFAGLVAGGVFPSPLPHAHVVTTTTHKTLRGPRGGMILCQTRDLEKKLNSAIFPGIQGGPLMHVIGAKAVAFGEALEEDFKIYSKQVIDNAKALGHILIQGGLSLISGGTDCHLLLVDLQSLGINGHDGSTALEHVGVTCNKNGIPYDPLPPTQTSGIRLGTPACTTRGMGMKEFENMGGIILDTLNHLKNGTLEKYITPIQKRVAELSHGFPLYGA